MELTIQEFVFPELDSTQLEAKRRIKSLAPNQIFCIIADTQTQGYGRYQRRWLSPGGFENLYCTFLIELPANFPFLTYLSSLLALSVAELLCNLNFQPKIKWPNDLLLNQKKVAGILAETKVDKKSTFVFLGLGLNLNLPSQELKKIDQPATSLYVESQKKWQRKTILKELEAIFLKNLKLFLKEGPHAFQVQMEKLLAYKNQTIKLFDGQNYFEGKINSLNTDGSLNLELNDRKMKTFYSGEISLESKAH